MIASNGRHPLESLPGIGDAVWATVAQLGRAHTSACLAVAAPHARAGTTTVAAAIALALAQHERAPVCLLESSVEEPALARVFGLRTTGLSDVLDGRAHLGDALQVVAGCPALSVLGGGTPRAAVPGELADARMRAIVDDLTRRSRYLVLDAPPILGGLDARPIFAHAHGAVLVVRAGVTQRSDARRAQRVLAEAGVTLLGAVFHEERRASGTNALLRRRESRAAVVERVVAVPITGPAATEPAMSDEERAREEAAHRREVEMLERRLKKLTDLLAQTEDSLKRVLAAKAGDEGVASVYRSVQGLSEGEGASKSQLLQEIFLANQHLQRAIAQRA
ncbi:MAG: tyrosine-protein kinase family protein [Planctomycetota bacterium]